MVVRVSENVRRLMAAMDWSEHDLAKRSGVSQKAINNLLNHSTGCTVTTAEKLARAFGLTCWQIMLDDVPADAAFSNTLSQLVFKFLKTDKKGRAFIVDAADRA